MQHRHRESRAKVRAPYGENVDVPAHYWERLQAQDPALLSDLALCEHRPSAGLAVKVLQESILVDRANMCLRVREDQQWVKIQDPFLELLLLVYLLNVAPTHVSGELCSIKDLKDAQFFQGPHALEVAPLLHRFGEDRAGFQRAAGKLDGEAVEMADAAYRLWPFPKIPLYFLLWEGDDEFDATLSILFDKTIEDHLAADGIWGMVNMVTQALLRI